ncbi:UDP-glycosyltransferase 90A1 [Ananas comosus]|uniref:Glycosyltransferase n=1 Tax=Ananas comosus TaxID=4615 RepID=A0A199UMK4_ANACO|nr:UDP-glycosyltransferase 90A1 [Ananas comosus]
MSSSAPSCASDDALPIPRVAIFPFVSKGHTIPLVHLARLLHRRRLAAVTFFATPLNAPFVRRSLAPAEAAIVELPNVPAAAGGVESADQFASASLFLPFVRAASLLRPAFSESLRRPTPPSLLVADAFLFWAHAAAAELGVPSVVFNGMGAFASAVSLAVTVHKPHAGVASRLEPFPVHPFPGLRLTRADLAPPFDDPDPKGPLWDFIVEVRAATRTCRGTLVNTFYELEPLYVDRWTRDLGVRAWCVGPLCLARDAGPGPDRSPVMDWLDSRLAAGRPVLYVAFGSQARLPPAQAEQLAAGLDRSGLDFLWAVRPGEPELPQVGERGRVVGEWVDQVQILAHGSVRGFVTHCGWNSVLESLSCGVPMLTWPMMAEQCLNAKFVVEELRAGLRLRLRPSGAADETSVAAEDVERMAKELILGETGKQAAARAEELKAMARQAMESGSGSSWTALATMIHDVCGSTEIQK